MKKIPLILIISILLASCQKKDFIQEKNLTTLNSVELNKTNAILFIEDKKVKTQAISEALFIDTVKYKAEWSNASSENLNSYYDILYVPIKYNDNKTGLVFFDRKS